MQTSQDVLARQQLERVIQLVPEEPAAPANLIAAARSQEMRRSGEISLSPYLLLSIWTPLASC